MSNIFEYLRWRGDLSFPEIRPCEIDSIILSMMSYIDFGTLAEDNMTLKEASDGYCADGKYDGVNLGLIMPSKQINRMFCLCGKTRRFGGVRITDFVSRISDSEGYQFCAMTFHLSSKQMMVVFRGTDDTIVGYKEDCCLSFLDEVPAQRMALEYLSEVSERYPEKRIYITGHSKGGNLALYSAVKSREEIQERIARVYCHDGPGLSRSAVASAAFKRMQRKLKIFVPQSSFIGIMFEKGEKYTVIKSNGRGLLQHDPFSWELEGPFFVKLSELSKRGKKNEEKFRDGMDKMSIEEKKDFVETLFSVIESTGAKTLSDFADNGLQKLVTFFKSYKGLDKEKRNMLISLTLTLLDLKKERKAIE